MFTSNRGGNVFNLYRKLTSGAVAEELLLESKINKMPEAWTASHGGLVLFSTGGFAQLSIWRLPLSGERKATPVMETKASEFLSEFSPDGRWIAYTATESATVVQRAEVYVRSYPALNGPWRVSTAGGNHARWSPDGRELFYLTPGATAIMAVDIERVGDTVSVGTPRPVIKTNVRVDHVPGGTPYDVSRDGRFLVNESITSGPDSGTAPGSSSFTVVLNWTAGL